MNCLTLAEKRDRISLLFRNSIGMGWTLVLRPEPSQFREPNIWAERSIGPRQTTQMLGRNNQTRIRRHQANPANPLSP